MFVSSRARRFAAFSGQSALHLGVGELGQDPRVCAGRREGGGSLVLGIDIAHAENDNLNDAKVEEEMEFTYRLQ